MSADRRDISGSRLTNVLFPADTPSNTAISTKVSECHVLRSGSFWFHSSPPLKKPRSLSSGSLQEQVGVRTPRRRWSSREAGSEDDLLMVKSMLDLRMLESYCAEEDEQPEVAKLHFQADVKA